MNESWFEDAEGSFSEINITPLVDVALVLLLIFMITAPMLLQGAEVRLPQTRPMTSLPTDGLVVTVDKEGRVFIDRDEVPFDDLVVRLSPLVTPGRVAYLRADDALSYGTVIQVLERIRRAGIFDVGLVVETIPGSQ